MPYRDYTEIGTSDAQIGDRVRVRSAEVSWETFVVGIDDFGMYLCATRWQKLWGYTTYHEPCDVKRVIK